MPEFDPSQPFEKIAQGKAPEFDPSQPFEKVDAHADHEAEAQAAGEHFGNAASMGYLPHLQAAAEKPMDWILDKIHGTHVSDDLPDYAQRRDENISRLKKQEQDDPIASTAGTVAGTVASSIPVASGIMKLPGFAKFATMVPEGASIASRTAALAARTGASATAAGIQGAISNPGDKEGEVDVLQPEERAKQGALSATIAAPFHVAGEGLSSVGQFIANQAKDKAEKLAFRALGPFKRQVNQNRDDINEVGREALDSGIIRKMPGSAATLEERANEVKEKTGKQLGDLTDELGKLEDESTASGMSRKKIADKIRERLVVENPAGIPGIDKRNAKFGSMIEDFEQDPTIKKIAASKGITYADAEKQALESGYEPKPMSFKDLRSAKMAVQGTGKQDGLINWNRLKGADIPDDEQFHRALASELREGEESGADAIEKAYYGTESNRLKDLKTKFGNQKTASEITGNKADAQRANQILGLKDAIYGSAGAGLGGTIGYQLDGTEGAKTGAALGGSVGALGNKLARDYGSQVSAKTLDSISKLLGKSPVIAKILQRNPTLMPQLIENLEKQQKR